MVETLEMTITATTRVEKFRSRLNERTVITFKCFDTNWVFSPQDPPNVNSQLTLYPATQTIQLTLACYFGLIYVGIQHNLLKFRYYRMS